jgi:hypothetical protein
MENDATYRPGNLMMGGGGRGFIIAPKEAGTGEWDAAGEEGDIVGEKVIRREHACEEKKSNGSGKKAISRI